MGSTMFDVEFEKLVRFYEGTVAFEVAGGVAEPEFSDGDLLYASPVCDLNEGDYVVVDAGEAFPLLGRAVTVHPDYVKVEPLKRRRGYSYIDRRDVLGTVWAAVRGGELIAC